MRVKLAVSLAQGFWFDAVILGAIGQSSLMWANLEGMPLIQAVSKGP
jgi:hypothetical protein